MSYGALPPIAAMTTTSPRLMQQPQSGGGGILSLSTTAPSTTPSCPPCQMPVSGCGQCVPWVVAGVATVTFLLAALSEKRWSA